MMRLVRLSVILMLCMGMVGCGLFKKSSRNREQVKVEEITQTVVQSQTFGVKRADIADRVVDKGVVVTETERTTVVERGGSAKVVVNPRELKPGENFLRDSAGHLVSAILDTLEQTLTISLSTPNERETTTERTHKTENRDRTSDREENRSDSIKKQVAITGNEEKRVTAKSDEKKSDPSGKAIVIGAVMLMVSVLVLLWYFGIRRRKV